MFFRSQIAPNSAYSTHPENIIVQTYVHFVHIIKELKAVTSVVSGPLQGQKRWKIISQKGWPEQGCKIG